MKNKFNKILIIFLLTFTFICNVDAKLSVGDNIKVEKKGGKWTVTRVEGKNNDECNLDDEEKLEDIKGVDYDYYDTIGHAYQNVCTEIKTEVIEYISEAISGNEVIEIANRCATVGCGSGTEGSGGDPDVGGSIVTDKAHTAQIYNIPTRNNSIIKVGTGSSETAGTNGPYTYSADTIKSLGYFLDYFKKCTTVREATRTCRWTEPQEGVDENGKPTTIYVPRSCTDYSTIYSETDFTNDKNATDADDYRKHVDASLPAPCHNEGCFIYPSGVSCPTDGKNDMWRIRYQMSHTYCAKVEAVPVEVFDYKLKIKGSNLEAYCVTPSAGWNKKYSWDYTFDASKCKNSLQIYKGNKISYDMNCGYAYILAEAKRLNDEISREKYGVNDNDEPNKYEDYFSYGVIELAMRLFGTGTTGIDEKLGEYIANERGLEYVDKDYLTAAGYYANYRGWGKDEYVGIPFPRGKGINTSIYPALYQYFMPRYYSIYLRTTKVVSMYLKPGIRFEDVGKEMKGKKYSNPFDYLNPVGCNELKKGISCSTVDRKIDITDGNNFRDDLYIGVSQNNFFSQGGKVSTCKVNDGTKLENGVETYMGVICGKNSEKLLEGRSGNSEDYLKAIYLYIRALQGNELKYEKKIEEKIVQYTPIEGQTKFFYEYDGDNSYPVIRYKIETDEVSRQIQQECDVSKEKNVEYCEAKVYAFDSKGNEVYKTDHYDYCMKNYCYVKVKGTMICDENGEKSTLTSIVITDPDIKATVIKKIDNGQPGEQTLYVYDPNTKMNGGFCQEIDAVKEELTVKCPCDPKESPNVVVQEGNPDKTVCDDGYKPYDELFYGDPSMSTILNACYDEDKLKYDFTEELNINGNDIMYNAEYQSKYSFQAKSDDFGVCKLYCRAESRFYIANKISVKAGQNLKYDIGQSLLDKKLINETIGGKKNDHSYMPSVVLELRECTSVINYKTWKDAYNDAGNNVKLKNQLLYSIYNCNLYTTEEIKEKFNNLVVDAGGEYSYSDITSNNKAEPAMIDYKYNTDSGKISVEKVHGTTKDYLLSQEGCTSLGYDADKCSSYNIIDYDDDYLKSLGIKVVYEHGLVKSNLNETIYCTEENGNECYRFYVDGKFLYNPNATNKNDYTTVDKLSDKKPESAKILSYNEWGLKYKDYGKNSKNYKKTTINGVEVPTNQYASFIVVTETGYYNNKKYYADRYTGIISNESSISNIPGTDEEDKGVSKIELDKNIYPLHLEKETGEYDIHHQYQILTSPYKRSKYYINKNYSLIDTINLKSKSAVDYYCTYDLYNPITKYEPEKNKKGLGIVYRAVNLNDMFESVTKETRQLPENWATEFAKENRNQIELSSNNILERDGNNDDTPSYLEYSYTLTPEGIKEIKKIAKLSEKLSGYLDNTLYDCEYDEKEGITYNCKSIVLSLLENGKGLTDGYVTVNKGDGISEFCLEKENEDKAWCKYQQKTGSSILGGE